MLAAENGALPGGKAGGVGDVLHYLPLALTGKQWTSMVLTPSYGALHLLPGARQVQRFQVSFASGTREVSLYQIVIADNPVRYFVIDHPKLSPGKPGEIYSHDDEGPFATDASKFAFFCAAAATCVDEGIIDPDIVHLHDWHAAFYLILRELQSGFQRLKSIRTVLTIHNLALQGIRPKREQASSFASWFPDLPVDNPLLQDPRYDDCVNPLAAAIRSADAVNTVSPSYAMEVLKPDNPETGFHGGEGLEKDLQAIHEKGALHGILNGCHYLETPLRKPAWRSLRSEMLQVTKKWATRSDVLRSAHYFALQNLENTRHAQPGHLLVTIGRVTAQKLSLLLTPVRGADTALQKILSLLDGQGLYLLLGSGDREMERQLAEVGANHRNFIFLNGFDETLSEKLYSSGDLFIMPSSFEPCGISQMLAMRAGQPCVVHGVGGLRDTVDHMKTGFVFEGETPQKQAAQLVRATQTALALKMENKPQWQAIRRTAKARRFDWDKAAADYISLVYAGNDPKRHAGH